MEKDLDVEGELVSCLTAPLPDARELQAACAEADIAAYLERGACCGKSGCGCAPKMQLLVAKEDVERVAHLLDQRWKALLAREGTAETDGAGGEGEAEHAPCPACGTAAPLVAGACSDCGLQLE